MTQKEVHTGTNTAKLNKQKIQTLLSDQHPDRSVLLKKVDSNEVANSLFDLIKKETEEDGDDYSASRALNFLGALYFNGQQVLFERIGRALWLQAQKKATDEVKSHCVNLLTRVDPKSPLAKKIISEALLLKDQTMTQESAINAIDLSADPAFLSILDHIESDDPDVCGFAKEVADYLDTLKPSRSDVH